MGENKCPRCGQLTQGSISDDGDLWPICEDCMHAEQRARARLADELQQERLMRESLGRPVRERKKRAM